MLNVLTTLRLMTILLSFIAWMSPAPAFASANDLFKVAVDYLYDGNGEMAVETLEKMLPSGDAKAESLLGVLLVEGVFVEKNLKRGLELLRSAAKKGDPEAQYRLFITYASGDIGLPITTEIIDFLISSASQNHPRSQLYLSYDRLAGEYLQRNVDKAKYWADMAVQNGEPLAKEVQFLLSSSFFQSGSKSRDKEIAFKALKTISDEGFTIVSFLLGLSYYQGLGVNKNDDEAFKWFSVAAYRGDKKSIKYRDLVMKKLNKNSGEADEWLVNLASNSDTYYGKTARWCAENASGDIDCLKRSFANYFDCTAPYFPGYFKNFSDSKGYSQCRSYYYRTAKK